MLISYNILVRARQTISLFAGWFQPAQTSQPTVFSSHNKPAPASPKQPRNQPANRPYDRSLIHTLRKICATRSTCETHTRNSKSRMRGFSTCQQVKKNPMNTGPFEFISNKFWTLSDHMVDIQIKIHVKMYSNQLKSIWILDCSNPLPIVPFIDLFIYIYIGK